MAASGEVMDLTTAITNFQQARVMSGVQMKVARKIMDMQEFQGAAVVKLIEAAGKIATGAGDSLVAAATGVGGNLDAYA